MRSIALYLRNSLSRDFLPLACLFLGVCLTTVMYIWSVKNEGDKARVEFIQNAAEFRTDLSGRIQSYIDILPGLKALSLLEQRPSDLRVRRFVSAISLQERFPGMAFIFIADHIRLDEREEYIFQVRNDQSLRFEGHPNFDITPSGSRTEYLVIRHVFPEDSPTIGYDLYDPSKSYRQEVDEAVSTGNTTATKPLVLARDRNSARIPDNTSIVIREPVYIDDVVPKALKERQRRLQGVVGVAFKTKELITSVLSKDTAAHMHIVIRDLHSSEVDVPIYDNALAKEIDAIGYRGNEIVRSIIHVANREWEIVSTDRVQRYAYWYQPIPLLVLVSGLSVSLLLTLILRILVSRTQVAELAVEDALAQVKRERRALEEAQSIAAIGSWEWDIKHQKLYWSAEMVRIYALTADEFIENPRRFFKCVPVKERKALFQEIRSSILDRKAIRYEHNLMFVDRRNLVLQVNSELQYDAAGQLRAIVGTVQDITDQRTNELEIQRLAFTDPLTNLVNRRLLIEKISTALIQARETDQNGALFFIDLDNFKTVNDAKGHAVGDALLVLAAERLKLLLQNGDTAARLGGDEFVLLVRNLSDTVEDANRVALQIAEAARVSLSRSYLISDVEYQSSASIGITLFNQEEKTYADLFREADIALYKAKSGGKNRVVFFAQSMQKEVEQKLALEHDLEEALQDGQLHIVVQSQFDSQRRRSGGELLLRWMHPSFGNIPPDKFIPLAEESGLIVRVGSWVLENACRTLAIFASRGITDTLSVNVSPRQFRQEEFVSILREMLAKHGAPPSQLILEITEGHLIDDIAHIIQRMQDLTSLGIRFSIDDFGTGYSSLAYLQKLPLYELKIDKSFIRDTLSHPTNTAIVQLILGMAKNLDLRVVAEGVETEDQFDFLVRERCEMMQGFLLGRPVPLETWCQEVLQIDL
ncbi:EAL domain-containing protein [Herbaspirillum rhizosphaerae]|uniref:EAL domain-containing protein n=1 Tax=Herbaspirillum rhizosphaerae TaxID=346179 RepID=A0ABW8ZEU6_9BURK